MLARQLIQLANVDRKEETDSGRRAGGIDDGRRGVHGGRVPIRIVRSPVPVFIPAALVAPPTLVTLPLRLLLVALPLPLLLVVAATVGTCIVAVVVIGERDVSRSGPDRRCQDEGCGNPADRRPYRVDVNCRSFHSAHPFLQPWRIARLGFRICPVKRRRGQCFFPIVWSPCRNSSSATFFWSPVIELCSCSNTGVNFLIPSAWASATSP